MMNWIGFKSFALFWSLSFLMLLFSAAPVFAFSIPERLEFDISYAGIPAGHAVQEVTQTGSDLMIVSTARSADWLKFLGIQIL